MPSASSVPSILTDALALTAADRAAFLDAACAGNPGLRAEVDGLIAAHDRAGGWLGRPGPGADPTTIPLPPPPAAPGAVLGGRYKLLERIGAGGMGEVWMAQQTDPVKRLVAVKLIRAGEATPQVLARFEAERQALALMDHPNIAKVFDAGAAPDGRPFVVMELIKGEAITKFCDDHRLTPRQRLELFVPVCEAVQHAHQKGIIHRDLKPNNVLVALYDDRPVPKVIDFGVAKAVGAELTDRTLHTAFGAVVGTPEYMSPEQAGFNQLDVDTRSDVYALGVLLYELLAGSPPFSRGDLAVAGLLEVLRVVREVEPPKPSTKLSSAAALPSIAARRGTEPRALAGLVKGELDWIVMKALEKDRTRRYETANGLAADVARHLAGEAVLAAPPSALYRVRKFARRHRALLGTAGAFAALLIAAVVVSAVLAVRARDARSAAEAGAENSRQLAVTLQQLLETTDPEAGAGGRTSARQILDEYAARLGDGLGGQPEVEADLRTTVGRAYLNLMVGDRAEAQFVRALELRRQALGPDHPLVAESLTDQAAAIARSLPTAGPASAADVAARARRCEAVARAAADIYRRAGGEPKAGLARALVVASEAVRAQAGHEATRSWQEAEDLAREAAALAGPAPGEAPSRLTADAAEAVAASLRNRGRDAEELAAYRRAADVCQAVYPGGDHPALGRALLSLGWYHGNHSEPAAAEAYFAKALAVFQKAYGSEPHSSSAHALHGLLYSLELQFNDRAADAVLAALPAAWRGPEYQFVGGEHVLRGRAYARLMRGDYAEAEALYRSLLKLALPTGAQAYDRTHLEARTLLAAALHWQGKADEVRAAIAADVGTARAAIDGPAVPPVVLLQRAIVLLFDGDAAAVRKLVGLWIAKVGETPVAGRGLAHFLLAAAYHADKNYPAAVREYAAARDLLRPPLRPPDDPVSARAVDVWLPLALTENGQPGLAKRELAEAVGRADLPPGDPEYARRRVALADFLIAQKEPAEAVPVLRAAKKVLADHPQADSKSLTRRRAEVDAKLTALELVGPPAPK